MSLKIDKFSHFFWLKISKERNMFVAERFLDGLTKIHGKHRVSTDGGGTCIHKPVDSLD
ncbi:MAG: hypothetical protein R2685_15650 [Candidatus Nitrosocosmicus sp.]|nr:hypothetical protein [Candidatus Nitrosocosmicus sp.]